MTTPLPQTELELLGVSPQGPAVVAVGGGLGLSRTLEAVQAYAGAVSAVVSVADDGGSSGRLAPALDIPPPGDLRKCLLALAPEPTIWSELFAHRFAKGDVRGHSLGNLMMAALMEITGDVSAALRLAEELLHCCGHVYPAALEPARMTATIAGRAVAGQVAIATTPGAIGEVRLQPGNLTANPAAVHALYEADQIVLSAGSLFTSLIAALIVPGIAHAINESSADLIYVMNLVTQNAETIELSATDHVAALQEFGGVLRAGTIIVHEGPLEVPSGLRRLGPPDPDTSAWTVVMADVADHGAVWPQHDPLALGRTLAGLAKS